MLIPRFVGAYSRSERVSGINETHIVGQSDAHDHDSSYIQPPFLNLMSLVAERAGRIHIRVGGNTQETARMVMSLPDGKAIEKQKVDTNNPVRPRPPAFPSCSSPGELPS